MEETLDFDLWLEQQTQQSVSFYAVYNPDTGAVTGIYPSHSAFEFEHKVLIDTDIAEAIFEGKISSNACAVDLLTKTFELIETRSLNKIENLLYRIPDKRWANPDVEPDIYISYDREKNQLTFELTEILYGARKSHSDEKKRKFNWDGETDMAFLITDHSDPNVLRKVLIVKIDELINQNKVFENIKLPTRFSIYTRRIFKNYVFDDHEDF
jgi:hypothetical protein